MILAGQPMQVMPTGAQPLALLVQLMLYQIIPGIALSSTQLLNGVSYSTALQNEYLTVSSSCENHGLLPIVTMCVYKHAVP